MPKLTKRVVDAIKPDPGGKERFVWDAGDGSLKGFGVRVMPGGTASYLVQYRTEHGRTRRLVIGRVGVLAPEEARALAENQLKEATKGGDPSADRKTARKALTVAELAELYLSDGPGEKPNKKPSSWNADRSNITRHILPLLGRKVAKSLSETEVKRFQADVAAGKSAADIKTKKQGRAIVSGGKGTAARSLAVLGAMLQFGVGRKLLPANPAKGVKLFGGEKKERYLSEVEVARLADTLTAMEAEGLSRNAAVAIRLLLLTGCRKDEILSLQWAHVDFVRCCLRLPDSKTGAKVVPIAAAALALLAALPRAGKWVLPASPPKGKADAKAKTTPLIDRGHYTGLQKTWERIRERATVALLADDPDSEAGKLIARLVEDEKLPSYSACVAAAAADGWAFPKGLSDLRLHDLRHSFASFAIADGATLFMVGRVLGHKQARTTEIYAHLGDDPVRAVADRAANRITAAMKGTAGGAEVVELPKRHG